MSAAMHSLPHSLKVYLEGETMHHHARYEMAPPVKLSASDRGKSRSRFLLCAIFAILLAPLSLAQAPVGTISGNVLDQNGAAVPNAGLFLHSPAGSRLPAPRTRL
jgi:hypothetical protein